MNFFQASLIITCLSVLLMACNQRSSGSAYTADYQQSLQESTAAPADNETVKEFATIFNQLSSEEAASLIDTLYADEFYFNDTFRTIKNDKPALREYLQQTGQSVSSMTITIDDIARSDNEVYLRWTMKMQFSVMGRQIDSTSIGISHLRFNEQGEIILHQDFWDGVDGFYQHLPVIGFWLKHIREQL